MEHNKIYCCDVLDGLRNLEDNSIDLIITSPPYNKAGLNGIRKHGRYGWGEIVYNGDINADNLPEEEYQKWQIEILNECFRVLKPDGSIFYNHKDRIVVGKGRIISPLEWILKSDCILRQTIIWDRGSTPNYNICRYMQVTEYIYWLTKTIKPRYKVLSGFKTDVWRLPPQKNTEHPAPFPIEIPDNIIPCVAQGEKITVLDPFMGSGTVAVSAIKHGCDYIGFEKFQQYIDLANKRIHGMD